MTSPCSGPRRVGRRRVPDATPILCVGITTYSPLRRAGMTKGQNVNGARYRLLKADVRYRFVIDMASLKSE